MTTKSSSERSKAPGPGRTHPAPGLTPETSPFLSIVVPAYNEERRLPGTLESITGWLSRSGTDAEVIVVENGSIDRTIEVVREFQEHHPEVHLIEGVPRGKGRAVRRGMLSARGRYRFLCDADLSMPIDQLEKFLPPEVEGCDVVIGSREVEGARRVDEPGLRHLMGRVFNMVVRLVVLPGIQDSQCGFKLLTDRAANDIFRRSKLNGWGFDPEILFIARKRGYELCEVPVEWHYNADSRVRPVHDTITMLREILSIRVNDWRGMYDE